MAEKREERMKEITERLEQGVQELFTSEQYTKYLKTMSQFHNYSFNNTLLIAMQKPDATLVAGYGAWQKKFNRQVKRGEKGIQIFAPVMVRKKEELEKFDPETNEPILRPDGQPETEEVEHIIPRFRVATVFDISQTEGEPLPELDTPELMGNVENFEIFMRAIKRVSPAPIRYAEIEGNTRGYYSNVDKEIVIQEGMSESQTMKTGIHEVTHAMCHDREFMEEAGEKKNQMTKEVEAESVAYTVCSYFGLDTSDYSFPYIAGWSSDMEMKELRSSMDFIRKTAGSFIDRMVENMQELQKEQPEKEHLEENDLMLKVTSPFAEKDTYFIVENMEKKELLAQLESYHDLYSRGDEMTVEDFLDGQGARLTLWYDSTGFAVEKPVDFFDVEYDYETGITDSETLPVMEQADMLMKREEYSMKLFDEPDREIIRNHAYKMDDIKTLKVYIQDLALAKWNPFYFPEEDIRGFMQSDIDGLPDKNIGLKEMHEFGYHKDSVLPLTMERAIELSRIVPVYSLQADGSSILMSTEQDILERGGIFGIEDSSWQEYERLKRKEIELHTDEAEFLFNDQDRYAIYQIQEDGKGKEYLFMGMEFLKKQNLVVERADYKMVYQDELAEGDTLDSLWEKFNIDHPIGFEGHSMSVSDVVAIRKDGELKCYYVDSFGYTELQDFLVVRQQEAEQTEEIEEALYSEEIQNPRENENLEEGVNLEESEDIKEEVNPEENEDAEKSENENTAELVTEQTTGLEVDGHFGTWHTVEKRVIRGESFFLMEEDDFGSSVDSVIVNENGELVAEDLGHGFDSGAIEAINVYFMVKEIKAVQENNPELFAENEENEVPVYKNSIAYAEEHEEVLLYRQSEERNIACKEAIEEAIRENFDGTHLDQDAAKDVMDEFGEERVSYVLAYTVQKKDWDHRFTSENRTWAGQISFPDENRQDAFLIDSHSAVLNGFIYLARNEIKELSREKAEEKPFISHYYVVNDASGKAKESVFQDFEDLDQALTAYAEMPNHLNKQIGMVSTEEPPSKMILLNCQNGWEEVSHIIFDTPDEKWVRMEVDHAITKARKFVDAHDIEAAYRMGEKYLAIQTAQEGYDYTIYDRDFREMDGGIFERPDLSLKEAMWHILHDLDKDLSVDRCQVIDYEEFQEKAETVAQEEMQKKRKEVEGEMALDSGQPEQEAKIRFYVAECVEFPVLGEFHENLESLQDAMELYEKIPAERMNGIKGIGFCLEDGSIYDGNCDLMVMGKMQTESINEIPHYKESPLVQKALADMEAILSAQQEKEMPEPEKKPEISEKTEEHKTGDRETKKDIKSEKNVSGGSKKQSVLNALRQRQARMKAQEKENQGRKAPAHKKGEQEL